MPRVWWDRLVVVAVVLLAWSGAARLLGPYWVSSPLLVLQRLYEMLSSGELWFHARYTLSEAFGGFVLGAVPGCLTAMMLRRYPRVEAAVGTAAAVGYAIPKTALVPLFILWFGVGPAAKVALVISAIFFIVFYSTLRGVKSVSPSLLLSARVLGASDWQLLRSVVWPAVVPYVFGGLRVAVPYAVAGAIVGEIISSNRGLGYLIQYGAMDFDTTLTFVAIATIMALVIVLTSALEHAQRRLLKWQLTNPQAAQKIAGI